MYWMPPEGTGMDVEPPSTGEEPTDAAPSEVVGMQRLGIRIAEDIILAEEVRKVFDDNGTFNHYIDCEDRAGGAAITGTGDWEDVIFGIHSTSRMTLSGGNKYNVGVLITEDVPDDIESWCE